MNIYKYPDRQQWAKILRRPAFEVESLEKSVSAILDDIRTLGDEAVLRYSKQFDGFDGGPLLVSKNEFETVEREVDERLKSAIRTAIQNIRKFHASQREIPRPVETMPGVQCWRKSIPVEKVGLYIPGGTAPLFSTVLMLGIPAKIAGCREIILCTPPGKDGKVNPAILYAAKAIGIDQVFRIGGVQAIGAMAYGTETVPAVNKIFGPGNQYVTCAKQLVNRQGTAIDLPAGPSELMVVADESAVPSFVAADLLSQAEHGTDSQVVLLAFQESLVDEVQNELERQVESLPRKTIALEALKNSIAILAKDKSEALEIVNEYAPEHLILALGNASDFAQKVSNAGSVFLGNYAPESVGDYASGTNHTLPTNGYAKAYSGVSLDAFVKKITFQKISPKGLQNIGPTVETMAEAEALLAHSKAVSIRLEALSTKHDGESKEIKENSVVKESSHTPSSIRYLLRENIRDITPYSSARSEFKGKAEVFLDANEHPIENGINRYPDPLQKEVKQLIADWKGIESNKIFLGNGSDEAIDLLIRAFCDPGKDKIIILPPTYGMYKVSANISGVGVRSIPLDPHFQPDTEAILGLGSTNSKILFLCNPNNPTGTVIPLKTIEYLVEQFDGLVIVDEAYTDFSRQESSLALLSKYNNLVVLQTFSKAWGMAGARLGMAFADQEVIAVLNKIKPPYNVNLLSQQAAIEALNNPESFHSKLSRILEQKAILKNALEQLEVVGKVFPSEANFFLVRVNHAEDLYRFLQKRGIIVRNRSQLPHCENCLRITIGTEAENQRLIKAIQSYQSVSITV